MDKVFELFNLFLQRQPLCYTKAGLIVSSNWNFYPEKTAAPESSCPCTRLSKVI